MIALGAAALALAGCDDDWDRKAGERALGVRPEPALSGAIFTTDEFGNYVNLNHFECKEDVYLDGGPPDNAPPTSAALPEGYYYFQVTNPSGHDLLSNDPIGCRRFHIDDAGLIDFYAPEPGLDCDHDTGIDADHGAVTVQLYPFDTTPNPGGVYKVWVTRVEDFDPPEGCDVEAEACEDWEPHDVHGFIPSLSKTDNFKAGECDKEPGKIKVCKYKVVSEYPVEFEPLPNWPITLLDENEMVIDEGYTGDDGCISFYNLDPGNYTVEEPESLTVNGFLWGPYGGDDTSKDVSLGEGETEHVRFENICVCNYDTNPECRDIISVKHADRLCPPSADPPPPNTYE